MAVQTLRDNPKTSLKKKKKKAIALVIPTEPIGWQRSNGLDTNLAFTIGQVKPRAPGHHSDPRRALPVRTPFRTRKGKEERDGAERGRGESARGKEREIFSKLRG